MTDKLIRPTSVTPAIARPGQPVRVWVRSSQGEPLDARSGIKITIDGMETYERYYQFAEAGERRVHLRAVRGAVVDDTTLTIRVEDEPLAFRRGSSDSGFVELPMLQTVPDFGHPYRLRFSLGTARQMPPGALPGPSHGSLAGMEPAAPAYPTTMLDRIVVGQVQVVEPQALAAGQGDRFTAAARVLDLGRARPCQPAAGVIYRWDFGDGTTAQTGGPAATHDYFPAIDAGQLDHVFHVTCHVGEDGLAVTRTFALQSAYALCKRRGTIVPHIEPDAGAVKGTAAASGVLTVHNSEAQDLSLTESAVVAAGAEPDGPHAAPQFVAMAAPIVLPAKSTTALATYVPLDAQPAEGVLAQDALGFTVYYRGHAEDGTPVRFSAAYTLPPAPGRAAVNQRGFPAGRPRRESWPWDRVAAALRQAPPGADVAFALESPVTPQVDRRTGTVALPVVGAGVAESARARTALLAGLHSIGERVPGGEGQPVGALALAAPEAPRAPKAGLVGEGQVCDPNNISPAEAAGAAAQGLTCQLSSQDPAQWVRAPGRFANALKGDVIISPGGPDVIGVLLRSLNQYHNHAGIMTQNYTEITHCTASEDRLVDYPISVLGVPIHIQPAALKYMWPGIITQSIDAAVYGEPWQDAGTQKCYILQCFAPERIGVDGVVTPPLVIKPDVESPEVRQVLREIADTARSMGARVDANGNIVVKSQGHYRLFGYTDPSIGLTQTAEPGSGWAEGTVPAVCSSFVWLCLQQHSIHMGGDAEPLSPQDGLYSYPAEARQAAAQVLFDSIADQVAVQAGWLGNFAARQLGIAEDIANQILNTFTCDEADPATVEHLWQNTGACQGVSPDDILSWVSPAQGGLYGYSEPLVFQEPRWEQAKVFRWTKGGAPGRLMGLVTSGGQPAPGARVQVYDGKSTTSDAHGRYRLEDLPQGTYEITARLVKDGVYYEVEQAVTLSAAEVTIDLALQPPTAAYRLAKLTCSFAGTYTELLTLKSLAVDAEQYWEPLNPGRVAAGRGVTYAFPDGHMAAFKVHLVQTADNSLQVALEGWIYDGAARDAGAEKAHAWTSLFNVPIDGQSVAELSLSASSLVPPWQVSARLTLLVANEQDPA